MNISRPFTLG